MFAWHVISSKEVRPDPEKLKAIKQFPQPTNVTEVKSFMGLANQLTNCNPDIAHMGTSLMGSHTKGNGLAVDRPAKGRFQMDEMVAQLERNCQAIQSAFNHTVDTPRLIHLRKKLIAYSFKVTWVLWKDPYDR